MKKYFALAATVAAVASINSVFKQDNSNEVSANYILQGSNESQIIQDVNSIGGSLVHQFSVIDAISVRLTDTQVSELKKLNPLVKMFKDQNVEVANAIRSFSSDNINYDLSNHTATWNGVNSSDSAISVDAIYYNLPYNNEIVESIEINGKAMPIDSSNVNGQISLSKKIR